MKLAISQVHFLTEALNSVTISAKDARMVVELQDVLEKEFLRLQKLQEKKSETTS
jgi:hypothetical protein